MGQENFSILILGAGKATRFKSELSEAAAPAGGPFDG